MRASSDITCCSYMADYEAWMELCDLYLHELDYQKAAYCMEEVIASNPHSHLYHQKYAEVILFAITNNLPKPSVQ